MSAKINGYSSTNPVVPVSQGAGAGALTADKPQAESTPAPASNAQGDQVTLTHSARSLQQLEAAVAKAPVVDAAKVAAVKQAVSSGTYKVNARSVADKLIQADRLLK